jgi:hypothetical protein
VTVTSIESRVCDVPQCPTALRADSPEGICSAHLARLRDALRSLYERGRNVRGAEMPTLAEEVRITAQREGRGAKVSIGIAVRSTEPQAPLADHRADNALRDLETVLLSWIRYLHDTLMPTAVCVGVFDGEGLRRVAHGYQHQPRCARTVEGMAEYLALRPSWLAETDEAGNLYSMVMNEINRCWRAIDRRPDRQYRGKCVAGDLDVELCGGDVFGWPDRKLARCAACGETYDSDERLKSMLFRAMGQELTAAEISKAVPQLVPFRDSLSVQTIHTWARNGRLVARRRNGRGWPLYSVRDVVDLALATPARNRRPRHAEEATAVA